MFLGESLGLRTRRSNSSTAVRFADAFKVNNVDRLKKNT